MACIMDLFGLKQRERMERINGMSRFCPVYSNCIVHPRNQGIWRVEAGTVENNVREKGVSQDRGN